MQTWSYKRCLQSNQLRRDFSVMLLAVDLLGQLLEVKVEKNMMDMLLELLWLLGILDQLPTGRAPPSIPGVRGQSSAQEDEAAELEAAMMMSLAETSGSGGAPAQLDSETMDQVRIV